MSPRHRDRTRPRIASECGVNRSLNPPRRSHVEPLTRFRSSSRQNCRCFPMPKRNGHGRTGDVCLFRAASSGSIATDSARFRPGGVTLLAALCLIMGSATAHAFNPDPPNDSPSWHEHQAPDAGRTRAELIRSSLRSPIPHEVVMSPIQQITERLGQIPLRPVSIGDEPHRPDDPELGAGVTVVIRF